MPPLVSVIIPAHNTEKKIGAMLESMISQDYPLFEILLVDDASTDGTLEEAKGVLARSPHRWDIITHERNRGVSAARNSGIANARGKYAVFADADDLAESGFISTLVRTIENNEADIAFCGHKILHDDSGRMEPVPLRLSPIKKYSNEGLVALLIMGKFMTGIWSTVFRLDFIRSQNLTFAEGCSAGEDVEFMTKAFSVAEKIAFTPEMLYIYRHHDSMGSRKYMDSAERKIRRYQENTDAHFRAANFIQERSPSSRVRELAKDFILPVAYIREFTILAKKGDKKHFYANVNNHAVRSALWRSRKFFAYKPEVFLKAVMLLTLPGFYFLLRSR